MAKHTKINETEYKEMVLQISTAQDAIWDMVKKRLKDDGVDLDERAKHWCSHRLDMESLLGDGPVLVHEYLNDERAPAMLVGTFEVPRKRVFK